MGGRAIHALWLCGLVWLGGCGGGLPTSRLALAGSGLT